MEEITRHNAALIAMEFILLNQDKLTDEYVHRDTNYSHMSIFEFAADCAVNYADALVDRLRE